MKALLLAHELSGLSLLSDIKKSDIIQMAQISSGGGGQSRYLLFALVGSFKYL